MMKKLGILGLFLICVSGSLHAKIEDRYASSVACKACHKTIVSEWETSLHAKSHYSKNELIKKTIEYMSLKTTLMEDQIVLNCSKCHNPRVEKDRMSLEELYSTAYGQDGGETHAMISSKYAKDGVNCITCHNVDKIHASQNTQDRGKKTVEWTTSGTMVGPFDDVNSPYHKSEYRPFFKNNPNQLCNVCHHSGESYYGLQTCETAAEYERSKSDESCVDCHMGEPVMRYIVDNNLAKEKRESRSHLFAGVRNSDIVSKAIEINPSRTKNALKLELINKTAHRVPTGYGDRVMSVIVEFLNDDDSLVGTQTHVMQKVHGDKSGSETISQLAQRVLSDTRLDVNEKRIVNFEIPENATKAKITLTYRLISEKWAKELDLKSQEYLKTYTVEEKYIKL
jgi:hypothetical protein